MRASPGREAQDRSRPRSDDNHYLTDSPGHSTELADEVERQRTLPDVDVLADQHKSGKVVVPDKKSLKRGGPPWPQRESLQGSSHYDVQVGAGRFVPLVPLTAGDRPEIPDPAVPDRSRDQRIIVRKNADGILPGGAAPAP